MEEETVDPPSESEQAVKPTTSSKPPTTNDSSDEELELLMRSKLPPIIPWRVFKAKLGKGREADALLDVAEHRRHHLALNNATSSIPYGFQILNVSFEEVASVSSVQPVLSLDFNEATEELIAGGVGNIRIWGFDKTSSATLPRAFKAPRLIISDLQTGEWVTQLCLDRKFNRIFAAADNNLMPLQYAISASSDGIIKVWTQQYHILYELREESNAPITGLLIPNTDDIKNQALPLLLASSLDGIIRLWSLDSGICLYALETNQECLGITWMRFDTFASFSPDKIAVWNLNRYFSNFSDSGSCITHLKRIEAGKVGPARILAAMADRSMKLISPVTGTTLFTAFPNMTETQIAQVEHDVMAATLWMLSASGDISVYTTQTNPARIVDEWTTQPGFEKLTYAGQIVLIPVNVLSGRQEVIVQAHAAKVLSICVHTEIMRLLSLGNGGIPNTLAVASSSNAICMYEWKPGMTPQERTRHPSDEDHAKQITCLTGLKLLNIFASCCTDGIVKIWDGYNNSLIKEIQFGCPLLAVCFDNCRGDLLVGLSNQIALVKVADYFPFFLLAELHHHSNEIEDDEIEKAQFFDENLDFWKLYKDNLLKHGKDLSRWHLELDPKLELKDDKVETQLDDIERKYQESQSKAAKVRESWQKMLREKRQLEMLVSRSPVHAATKVTTPIATTNLKEALISEKFEEFNTTEGDPALRTIEAVLDDEGISDTLPLDDSVKIRQRRVSSFATYIERQKKLVQKKLDDENFEIQKMSKALQEGDQQLAARVRSATEPSNILLERLAMRKRSLSQSVKFVQSGPSNQVNGPRTASIGSHPPSIIEEEEATISSSTRVNENKQISHQPEKSGLKKGRQTSIKGPANVNLSMKKPQKVQLLNPNQVTLKVPPPRRRTSFLPGISMPNSVAAASDETARAAIHRRTSQAVGDGEDPSTSTGANEQDSQDAKSFVLPEYLRSRRRRSVVAPLQDVTSRKSAERPDLEEADDEDDHDNHLDVPEKVVIIVPAEVKPENLAKSVVVIEKTIQPVIEVVKPLTPIEVKEPPDPESTIVPVHHSMPEILIDDPIEESVPALTIEARAPSVLELSRAPSVVIPQPTILSNTTIPMTTQKQPVLEFSFTPKPIAETKYKSSDSLVKMQSRVKARKASERAKQLATSIQLTTGTDSVKGEEEDSIFELDAETKMFYKQAWDLIEVAQAELPKIPSSFQIKAEQLDWNLLSKDELIKELTAKDWFPGLNGKEANIQNILEVTMKVMHHGAWREKCEASKAMLYLYHTFENDLPNAIRDILIPQLDLINDEAWQVRTQVAANLAAYRVKHPEIMLALISKLSDKNEAVRRAVKNALATFGVSSKESLRNAMIELHMIPSTLKSPSEDWLEVLLTRMRRHRAHSLASNNSAIEKWRRNVRVSKAQFHRFPSVCQTLTYNAETAGIMTSEQKAVHDLLSRNLEGHSLAEGSLTLPPLQEQRKSYGVNRSMSVRNGVDEAVIKLPKISDNDHRKVTANKSCSPP
ncbi:hypothetical protein BC830DRAFT_1082509 [Chytriomyces sp. MP71]|nr:hypothetical protein BC830DRAFT_1082509 [Chytriomyces sp. MP71]